MKIGIVSDSHGQLDRLRRAMHLLAGHQPDAIVHCGDIVDPASFEILAETGKQVYAVAGNMDRDTDPLEQAAESTGVHFSPQAIEVPLGDGDFLIALHGDDESSLNEYLRGQQFPYVCHGHTHRTRDEKYDKARVINPGALHKPKDPPLPCCAMLDTQADSVLFVELKV